MSIKDAWKITKHSVTDFFDGNILKLSASLAFFTIFSLPGLLIIIIWVSDIFYGRDAVEGTVYHQIEGFVGHDAALNIQETIRTASQASGSTIATIIGVIALIIGATSAFSEIQDSINRIWRLKAKPKKGFGFLKMLFNRLLSFSMIITLGFIFLVSLIINGALDLLLDRLMILYPHLTVVLVYILNLVLTYIITAFIFAAIFKVLPDARIKWKHVRIGACVTAALFMLGKFVISYYLGHNRMTSAYGAAGSIIVVLLWVYYSSMILYFGAAFTHAYVIHKGSRIYPNNYAVWVQQIEVESETSIRNQPETKRVIEVAVKQEPDIPST
ncbi:MAG TPA: YihY/virulence factor BrkB family protein [Chitinophagaceae bacterium]|jgi:membrane protein|nr:YihY/virulence factor BrkB family protein [Chitinophagaceae bacterium]